MTADEYNARQLAIGALSISHVTRLVRHWQESSGLTADGMAGPRTIGAIDLSIASETHDDVLTIDADGWLSDHDAARIPAHISWYGQTLIGGKPGGIVVHTSDTDPGTAFGMARRRQHPYGTDPDDRSASWHVSIEADGSIVQMIPLTHVAWHAGGANSHSIPGLGSPNSVTVGIELIGWAKTFPAPQVVSAKRVWRAIVRKYGIARTFAMITHQSIDPIDREDPGPIWMAQHAPDVLTAAYA